MWNDRVGAKHPNFWVLAEHIWESLEDVSNDMKRLNSGDASLKITRHQRIKNVLNTECLRKAEEKLRNGRGDNTYTPMKFLKAARHSFATSNKRYFDQVQNILTDDLLLGGNSDSDEEQEPTDEVEQEAAQAGRGDCGVCMDSAANTVLVPCGHNSICYDCAALIFHNENENMPPPPKCPVCRVEITHFIRLI